jgi:glutathionylspermidine amidase/synthetase
MSNLCSVSGNDETHDRDHVAGNLATRAPFGAVLGYAPGGVPAFSSNYGWRFMVDLCCCRSSSYSDSGVYYGFKYQCVEFARRWLINVMSVTFESVDMAYEVFELSNFHRLPDLALVRVEGIRNGSICTELAKRPAYGNVIIWNEGGYFKDTGHIGIITEATDSYVRIAEQNYNDLYWGEGHNYSRELPVLIDPATGACTIVDSTAPEHPNCGSTSVCGWIRIILPEQTSSLSTI